MEKITLQFDLYGLFDRPLEGVLVDIFLDFDPMSILENNTTEDNLKVTSLQINPQFQSYLKSLHFKTEAILKDTQKYLNENNRASLLEMFFEDIENCESSLSEEEKQKFIDAYFAKYYPS